jgi:hypothetical protein
VGSGDKLGLDVELLLLHTFLMMPNHPAVTIKPETKTLLDALVLLSGKPIEDVLHQAVLKMFGTPPELVPGGGLNEGLAPTMSNQQGTAEMTLADRIREFVLRHYVEPARQRGERFIEVSVRDVHGKMGLEQRHSAVIAALQAKLFGELGHVRRSSTRGPKQSSSKVFRFELL